MTKKTDQSPNDMAPFRSEYFATREERNKWLNEDLWGDPDADEIAWINACVTAKVRQPPELPPTMLEHMWWRSNKEAGKPAGPEPVVPPEDVRRAMQVREAYQAQLKADDARAKPPKKEPANYGPTQHDPHNACCAPGKPNVVN